jgi:hypothetical protein
MENEIKNLMNINKEDIKNEIKEEIRNLINNNKEDLNNEKKEEIKNMKNEKKEEIKIMLIQFKKTFLKIQKSEKMTKKKKKFIIFNILN